MRSPAIRTLCALLAIGFFATPVALRALGVTADAFENRKFAQAPKLSQGWDAFAQTTQFLTDRMPLRAQAVRVNTRIWTDVFGTAPRYAGQTALAEDGALPFAGAASQAGGADAPASGIQVLRGRDGWLFLQDDLTRSCFPAAPFGEALARWRALVREARAGGHRAVLIVPPDKASIYPEHLPEDYVSKDCALDAKRAFWRLLAGQGPAAGIVGLYDELLRVKRRAGDDLYARKDSHWTTLGALAMVRAALEEAPGGVTIGAGEAVNRGSVSYTGDLTVLAGNAENDNRVEYGIARASGAPRVPGRTLVIGDSFSEAPLPLLEPYFERLRRLPWVGTEPDALARAIRRSDTVVLETVEREFTYRATGSGPVAAVLDALQGRSR